MTGKQSVHSPLTKRQRTRLAQSGADGSALARAVADTSPVAPTGQAAAVAKARKAVHSAGSQSASSSLARSLEGGSGGVGLGVFLPFLLGAAGLGAVALLALRRRRRAE